jgi:hypothetical protein
MYRVPTYSRSVYPGLIAATSAPAVVRPTKADGRTSPRCSDERRCGERGIAPSLILSGWCAVTVTRNRLIDVSSGRNRDPGSCGPGVTIAALVGGERPAASSVIAALSASASVWPSGHGGSRLSCVWCAWYFPSWPCGFSRSGTAPMSDQPVFDSQATGPGPRSRWPPPRPALAGSLRRLDRKGLHFGDPSIGTVVEPRQGAYVWPTDQID